MRTITTGLLVLTSCFPLFLIVVTIGPAGAQDLEAITSGKKPLSVSGGIQANSIFYKSNTLARRDPHTYFLSGNVNMSLYGWSIPLSFTYADQRNSFYQPFSQYGISPTFKGVTLHAGYRSMVFSNYTVNGHMFLGAGFEITASPKLRFAGLYGRFQKAVKPDTTAPDGIGVNKRMGFGLKTSIGTAKNYATIILFKAVDTKQSPDDDTLVRVSAPQENLVLSLGCGAQLFSRLAVRAEVAASAFTRDTRSEVLSRGGSLANFLFTSRASSSIYRSYQTALQYRLANADFAIGYERVDPGYRTLGAYYFNNDLETLSLTNGTAFLKRKLRINTQIGIQRNNLDETQVNETKRVSGAVNLGWNISGRLMASASYSNFRTVINFRPTIDTGIPANPVNADTMNYRQVATNATFNISCVTVQEDARQHAINASASFQNTADHQSSSDGKGTAFTNFNCSYSMAFAPRRLFINAAINIIQVDMPASTNLTVGPSLSARKSFYDRRLGINATVSANRSHVDGEAKGDIFTFRLSGTYVIQQKHNLNLSVGHVTRSNSADGSEQIRELTIQFGYTYNFTL